MAPLRGEPDRQHVEEDGHGEQGPRPRCHAILVEVNTRSHSPVAGGTRAGVGDERNDAELHVYASGQQQCAASLRHEDGAEVTAGTCGGPLQPCRLPLHEYQCHPWWHIPSSSGVWGGDDDELADVRLSMWASGVLVRSFFAYSLLRLERHM